MLLAAALAAGCTFAGDRGGAHFACDSLTPCPDGLACVAGYCEASDDRGADGGHGASGIDGASGEDGAASLAWKDYAVGRADATGDLQAIATEQVMAGFAGDLYVAFVSTKPARGVQALDGLGMEWSLVRRQCTGRSTASLAMYRAVAPAVAAGAITAILEGDASPGSAVISVHRYAGADPDDPIGEVSSANSNGHDADAVCAGGDDTTGYEWREIDTDAPGSIVVSGAHTANFSSHTPGEGYTERADDQSGATSLSAGVAVQDQAFPLVTEDVAVSGDFAGEEPDWAVIAAEIRD